MNLLCVLLRVSASQRLHLNPWKRKTTQPIYLHSIPDFVVVTETPTENFVPDVQQHPTAIVRTDKIGAGSRIWAFVNILPGAVIGKDANVCDHVFIEDDVIIGDRVTIKCGVQLWNGTRIEDDVFIGPNATFTNDRFPRSKKWLERVEQTIIRRGASVGANATILPGITIGINAMIGAGAVVTRDVPPNAIVAGNPARIRGYVDTGTKAAVVPQTTSESSESIQHVRGVRLIDIPKIEDLRGSLSFGEIEAQLPFIPKRFFVIHDVPSKEIRGEHAHRKLQQLLICLKGSVSCVVDDGKNRAEIRLTSPQQALLVPPRVWAIQYRYSPDAVLLVLASDKYSAEDYVRDYDEFQAMHDKGR
jgi:UDP-2-acetamido-3-amino-2,3-dideoxy-glucuronate N-acetyltransferase